jgi:hypothetical protein
VLSIQTLPLAHPLTAVDVHLAGRVYWDFLRRIPFLRVDVAPDGGVRIRLTGITLLAFTAPVVVPLPEGLALRYPIGGGAAVHPAHSRNGYLQMGVERSQVSLAVEGYFPNLVRVHPRIYEWTQAAIHLRIARGYLPLLAEVVGGAGADQALRSGSRRD